ncbi:MAG TPA: ThuA domain-containing protein, partial [Verrucomicrobiae bacterium]|jgi:type 1 glutamine amidotransferase
VIFANTTGDLPIPDRKAFIDWVHDGHAFIGMHSASDTLHHGKGDPAYIDMLGGEFQTHNEQVSVDAINRDTSHPATKHLGPTFTVFDEIYIIIKYNPAKVHELLSLDAHPNSKKPGHYAISWCKDFGQGKVFYTSLGHREDVWSPDEKGRKNSKEVSEAYQKHILGGIKWALGLEPGDGTPQAK